MPEGNSKSGRSWWNRQPASVRVAIITLIGTVITTTATIVAVQVGTPTSLCAVSAATDRDTLRMLLDMEADAVLAGDIDRITSIYSSDATVRNGASGEEWLALVYYTQKFSNEIHCHIEHHALDIELRTDYARVTSASRGDWGWKADGVCTLTYDNPPASDEWYLSKDSSGCWRIDRFVFNSQSEP